MKKLFGYIKNLTQNENGGVLILVALLMLVLMGMTALAIDVGGLYHVRRQTVNAADASALAAAMSKKDDAPEQAEYFAEEKNNTTFEGIKFTEFGSNPGQGNPGPGQPGQSNTWIVTVLVSKQYNYTFARALGFQEQEVIGIASAQRGPGNALVPFGMLGVECFCCDEDAVLDGDDLVECGCNPDDANESEYGCGCKVGYEDKIWKVENEDGECLKPGEHVQLKFKRWNESGFGAGNFGTVRLPGQQGGNDLRTDIAGGYSGTLDSIKPGEPIINEPGNKVGPVGHGLDDRIAMAGGEITCTIEGLLASSNPYDCEMVVVVPIVEIINGQGGGASVDLRIVGYASFFLDHVYGDGGDEVHAWLLEYLTYAELPEVFDSAMEGFVIRLVKDPQDAVDALLNAFHNK